MLAVMLGLLRGTRMVSGVEETGTRRGDAWAGVTGAGFALAFFMPALVHVGVAGGGVVGGAQWVVFKAKR